MTSAMSFDRKIARPGANCREITRAERVSFLVDADSYFRAFKSAAEKARHSILIAGWDIDSRILLERNGEDSSELPATLGEFLNKLVKRKESLTIHLLIWDYSMLFTVERDPLLLYRLSWRAHNRLEFKFDGRHPVGASHHQKIVVIDDKLAFSGGLDFAMRRWDTPEHIPGDPRRADPRGDKYSPFHDIQMAVDGDAAAALGKLVRERWLRAADQQLEPPPASTHDPWPENMQPDMTDATVAISLTDTSNEKKKIKQVERLYKDIIAAADKYLYIENLHFTSSEIAEALIKRLKEEKGPEIVMISPKQGPRWIEQNTLGLMRTRLIKRLEEEDRFGRFRIYYPFVSDGDEEHGVFIHAKVLIADDTLVRIGSANLSNRSMGLDTECDLAIEVETEAHVRSIKSFRDRLLGEHLGLKPEVTGQIIEEKGSLIEAIESVKGENRGLRPIPDEAPEMAAEILPESTFFDPVQPFNLKDAVENVIMEEFKEPGRKRSAILFVTFVILLAALGSVWQWSPLSKYVDPGVLVEWAEPFVQSHWAPLYVLAAYLIGGLIVFPVTVMILATSIMFSPVESFVYAMTGSMASACMVFGLGELLGRDVVRKLAGDNVNKVSKRLAQRGLLMVMALRIIPVAPFTIINLVAGVTHVRFRDYLLGTLIGMAPGVVAITIFGDRLVKAVKSPNMENVGILIAIAVALIAGFIMLRRFLKKVLGTY